MLTLQTASGTEVVPGTNEEAKIANLVARRSIILALVGSTPEGNDSVDEILANGYLGAVKLWLNDTLKGTVGTFFSPSPHVPTLSFLWIVLHFVLVGAVISLLRVYSYLLL